MCHVQARNLGNSEMQFAVWDLRHKNQELCGVSLLPFSCRRRLISEFNSQAKSEWERKRKREREFSLQPFHSVQASNGLGEAHPIWGGPSTVFSQLIQMLISSRNTLTDTLGNNVLPNIWSSCAQASWHIKITVMYRYFKKSDFSVFKYEIFPALSFHDTFHYFKHLDYV